MHSTYDKRRQIMGALTHWEMAYFNKKYLSLYKINKIFQNVLSYWLVITLSRYISFPP